MSKSKEVAEQLDPSIREARVGTASTNTQRVCYAAKTLVAEVMEMFPETPVEFSNFDGRNTALDVTFDLTAISGDDDRADLTTALTLLDDPAYNEDARIAAVLVEDGAVLVSFKSNAATQDSREPFGLIDAMSVLAGEAVSYEGGIGSDHGWGSL
jgi:hypothetical protein